MLFDFKEMKDERNKKVLSELKSKDIKNMAKEELSMVLVS